MIETLYKVRTPEKGQSECYVLVLTSRAGSGRKVYAFMEEHGQLDDNSQRFVYQVSSINTEDEMTYQDALELYNMAKRNLSERGFVHSFVPDYHRNKLHEYQLLEPDAVVA